MNHYIKYLLIYDLHVATKRAAAHLEFLIHII